MSFKDKLALNSHWLIRFALAGIFLFHGPSKFPMAQGMADMMGMHVFMVYALATAETLGGIFIILGGFGKDWMTRAAGLIFSVVMIGAIVKVHWGQWAFAPSETHPMGGMEFQVLVLAISLFVFLRGNRVPNYS